MEKGLTGKDHRKLALAVSEAPYDFDSRQHDNTIFHFEASTQKSGSRRKHTRNKKINNHQNDILLQLPPSPSVSSKVKNKFELEYNRRLNRYHDASMQIKENRLAKRLENLTKGDLIMCSVRTHSKKPLKISKCINCNRPREVRGRKFNKPTEMDNMNKTTSHFRQDMFGRAPNQKMTNFNKKLNQTQSDFGDGIKFHVPNTDILNRNLSKEVSRKIRKKLKNTDRRKRTNSRGSSNSSKKSAFLKSTNLNKIKKKVNDSKSKSKKSTSRKRPQVKLPELLP
jgi:hypothetical protein